MKSFLLLLLLLIGCGGGREESVRVGKFGGTLVISTISDPKSFNEIIAKETSTTAAVGFLFEGLTETDGITTEVIPCLAKEWSFSSDGLVWTFHLRRDVSWFDGMPFTSEDVIFTFNQLIYNPTIPASARDIFTIDGKKLKVVKVDDYTVKFILPRPFAPLLRYLTQPILPKHVLEDAVKEGRFNSTWGVDTPPEELIGTGPFMLVEYKPAERLVYARNPNYWKRDSKGRRLPYLERIVMLIFENQEAQLVSFEAGELDVLGVREKDFAYLKRKEKRGDFTLYNCGPAFGTNFLVFNQNPNYVKEHKLRWFRDLNFRRAIAHSIDKTSIINNVMGGLGYPQTAAMSKAAKLFHNPNVRVYKYSLREARNYLERGGYIDRDGDGIREDRAGVPVKFTLLTNAENNIRKDIGVIITEDLKKIGLDVTFTPIDFNTLVTKLDSTYDWDAVLIGLTGGVDPHGGKNVWESSGHLHMWNLKPKEGEERYEEKLKRWRDGLTRWEKEIDEIFNEAVSELNEDKRRVLYFRWQEIVAEELPLIYTVSGCALYAVRNRVGGVHPTSYGGVLHNVEELYILSR